MDRLEENGRKLGRVAEREPRVYERRVVMAMGCPCDIEDIRYGFDIGSIIFIYNGILHRFDKETVEFWGSVHRFDFKYHREIVEGGYYRVSRTVFPDSSDILINEDRFEIEEKS